MLVLVADYLACEEKVREKEFEMLLKVRRGCSFWSSNN